MRQDRGRGAHRGKGRGFHNKFRGNRDDRPDSNTGPRRNFQNTQRGNNERNNGPSRLKGKRINKHARGHPRRREPLDLKNRDFDRELRNYFVRDTKEGAGEEDAKNAPEGTIYLRLEKKERFGQKLHEKLNQQMDDYWKARKQQAANKAAQ